MRIIDITPVHGVFTCVFLNDLIGILVKHHIQVRTTATLDTERVFLPLYAEMTEDGDDWEWAPYEN